MKTKKISIIIPHFNSVRSLEKLIKSIPKVQDIEILIIDDKSDRGLKKDLEKLSLINKNIVLLFNQTKNKSAGTCRNIGIEKSKGEWLLFADADDFFLDNMIKKINKSIANISKNIDIIYFIPKSIKLETNTSSYRATKFIYLMKNYLRERNRKNELKLRYCMYVPWSKLIKRDLIVKNNIKFDETIVSNDIMFSVKAGKIAKDILVVDDEIYCVTENEKSLTSIKDPKRFDIRVDIFIRYYQYLSEEERKWIGISPLPLILEGRNYGVKKIFYTFKKMKKNNVKVIKYFHIEKYKIKILFYKLAKIINYIK